MRNLINFNETSLFMLTDIDAILRLPIDERDNLYDFYSV